MSNFRGSPQKIDAVLLKIFFDRLSLIEHKEEIFIERWLNKTADFDPELALVSAELYLKYVQNYLPHAHLYDSDASYPQLFQKLFIEAQALETEDNGNMLRRVFTLQDQLSCLGVREVYEWLKDSERM